MKFQDKFYDIFDHNKCPPSETEDEKCIFRKSYFHRIQPTYHKWYFLSVRRPPVGLVPESGAAKQRDVSLGGGGRRREGSIGDIFNLI